MSLHGWALALDGLGKGGKLKCLVGAPTGTESALVVPATDEIFAANSGGGTVRGWSSLCFCRI